MQSHVSDTQPKKYSPYCVSVTLGCADIDALGWDEKIAFLCLESIMHAFRFRQAVRSTEACRPRPYYLCSWQIWDHREIEDDWALPGPVPLHKVLDTYVTALIISNSRVISTWLFVCFSIMEIFQRLSRFEWKCRNIRDISMIELKWSKAERQKVMQCTVEAYDQR